MEGRRPPERPLGQRFSLRLEIGKRFNAPPPRPVRQDADGATVGLLNQAWAGWANGLPALAIGQRWPRGIAGSAGLCPPYA